MHPIYLYESKTMKPIKIVLRREDKCVGKSWKGRWNYPRYIVNIYGNITISVHCTPNIC
jgi:hypothetical protein